MDWLVPSFSHPPKRVRQLFEDGSEEAVVDEAMYAFLRAAEAARLQVCVFDCPPLLPSQI